VRIYGGNRRAYSWPSPPGPLGAPLTAEQIALIDKANRSFTKGHTESSPPCELLAQELFSVVHPKGVGKVYLDAVVDTLGYLHMTKLPEAVVVDLQRCAPVLRRLGHSGRRHPD
jgi:hypothetical protein